MKIINKRIFTGKNIYSYKKCIRIDVDLCGYCEVPSKNIKGFNNGLLKLIPELYSHRCGIDEEGGFVKRLNEGTYLAHICEHIIIAIQNKIGIDVSYGKAREINGDIYYIVFEYIYQNTAMEVARLAIDIINSLINGEHINYDARIKILNEILSNETIGPSTLSIIQSAKRYGMPAFELEDSGFFQIGYGKQGRIVEATIGSSTSCVAADIASDKVLSKKLLYNQNIPVAKGTRVYNIINLLKEVEEIGYPVVLKPRYGSKGKGVILNIKNEQELVRKYNASRKLYKDLIVEKYIEGNDYRVCVVDYSVVAVSHRIPPYIIGDGIHNIKYLIMKLNEDPMRGIDHEKPLTKIKIDNEMLIELKNKNMSLSYIPKKNEKINLRENGNISTGGIAVDCTDIICEENIDICIRAARAIGLDICGIDIKTKDISKPIYNEGVVVEVNAAPGIRMHKFPHRGKSIDVGEAIVKEQYNGIPKNIPVISVTGTNGKTTTTRLISHVLSSAGYKVGMTSTDGIYIDGKCIDTGDDSGYYSAKTILLNKEVEAAVLETARGGIIKNGLAYDVADVAVLTNITEDHLGLNEVNSIEDLAFVKSLVVEAVKEEGYAVINADDKYSRYILPRIKCRKIYFSMNCENPLIKKSNKEKDSISVYVLNNEIVASENGKIKKIASINSIPITLNGMLEFNIENSLAACSALIAIGIDYMQIARGLKTFKLDSNFNSGRFNIFNVDGVKVVLDYGHNIEGYKCVLKSLTKIRKKEIIGIIGVPGDRENSHIEEIGKICTKTIDKIIIKEDKDRRGREKGEVAKILEKAIKHNKNKKCMVCLDEVEALKRALNIAAKDDIIVVFYEKLEPLIEVIKSYDENYSKLNLASS